MYFSNNPKIRPLLAEVAAETATAEAQIKLQKRKDTFTSILKNRWFWCGLVLVIGILMIISGMGLGFFVCLGGVVAMIATAPID